MAYLESHSPVSDPPPRPFSVTLLTLEVLITTGIYLVRFAQAIEQWSFLAGLLPISPLYLALSGLIWGLIGLPLTWGLWRGKPWAPRWTRLAALLFSLYYWLDRVLFSTPTREVNWPFAVGLNVVLYLLMLWILSRQEAKAFFGVIHE